MKEFKENLEKAKAFGTMLYKKHLIELLVCIVLVVMFLYSMKFILLLCIGGIAVGMLIKWFIDLEKDNKKGGG